MYASFLAFFLLNSDYICPPFLAYALLSLASFGIKFYSYARRFLLSLLHMQQHVLVQLNDSGFCCERDDSYKKREKSLSLSPQQQKNFWREKMLLPERLGWKQAREWLSLNDWQKYGGRAMKSSWYYYYIYTLRREMPIYKVSIILTLGDSLSFFSEARGSERDINWKRHACIINFNYTLTRAHS